METVRVSLFGKFCVELGGEPLERFDAGKLTEIFSYLLIYRGRPHAREKLASLLWSDSSTTQSKTYLRKTLWQLQTALNHHALLLVDPEWVQINAQVAVWLDVQVLEDAFNLVKGLDGRDFDPQTFDTVRSATDIYRGDLLEGWYLDWCLHERERLQYVYLILLEKLMNYCEAHGQFDHGLTYGMRVLGYNQARERTHRCLMRLYYAGGYRTDALKQYKRCTDILNQELGVAPSRQTTALFEQIRADQFVLPDSSVHHPKFNAPVPPTPLDDLLATLIRLNHQLHTIQEEVQQKIEAVELLRHQ